MFGLGSSSTPTPPPGVTLKVHDDVLGKGNHDLIGSIDQGTSSSRFLVFTPTGKIGAWAQMEHEQIFPAGEDKVRGFSWLI